MFPINYAIKRVPVAGKILTSVLKDFIKSNQYNLNNDILLLNDIKHKTSFVSNDFNYDMNNVKKNQ